MQGARDVGQRGYRLVMTCGVSGAQGISVIYAGPAGPKRHCAMKSLR